MNHLETAIEFFDKSNGDICWEGQKEVYQAWTQFHLLASIAEPMAAIAESMAAVTQWLGQVDESGLAVRDCSRR